jgi:hypothetical protein
MRTVRVVCLFACLPAGALASIGGAALAGNPAPPDLSPLRLAQASTSPQAGAPAAVKRKGGSGSAGHGAPAEKPPAGDPASVSDALKSCLAMWDSGTHMSKPEWARACRRVAERLNDTSLR